MKLLVMILFAATLLTGCSTTHPWMDRAMVGTVDGEQVVVLFPAGDGFYRPQFSSDCRRTYNKNYQMDNNSTGCRIAAERVSNLRGYRESGNTVQERVRTDDSMQIHSNNIITDRITDTSDRGLYPIIVLSMQHSEILYAALN